MPLQYNCTGCSGTLDREELLDDPFLEQLVDAKRCPQCGASIDLSTYIVDNETSITELESLQTELNLNTSTMNPDDD